MKTKEFILGVIGLIVIVGIFYYLIKWVAPFIGLISLKDATSILPFVVPVVVAIVTIYLGRSMERTKIVQEKLREKKLPIYDDFIAGVLKFILDKEIEQEEKDKELVKFLQVITPKMIIWTDDEVLKAWADFRTLAVGKADGVKLVYEFEKVLLAIRKDLGHKNKNLNNHEVLKCFINDLKD